MAADGDRDDESTRLALAAGRGDRVALGAWIAATQADVYRFLRYLVGEADAEDLTQETYLRALRSLRTFAGRSSARSWLLVIARRVAADHLRRRTLLPVPTQVDWDGAPAAGGGDAGFTDEVEWALLLDTLEPSRREAIVLTQIIGLEYAEAAAVCGCPIGTIRSRVARARQDLARLWFDTGSGRSRSTS